MYVHPLKSIFPTADELLDADEETLAMGVLAYIEKNKDTSPMWQIGRLSKSNFEALVSNNKSAGLGPAIGEPEYGSRQPDVAKAVMEAFDWLVYNGYIGKAGEYEQYQLTRKAVDRAAPPKRTPSPALELIDETRLAELRQLPTTLFDFTKLIRLCEELNTVYREGCYFSTAMLTRGLLDHVPPIFGKNTFSEVGNNYSGGGKSFKDAMHHLENASRKVADAHLHMPIRKSETLPVAQQVNCAQQLDLLLAEIIRITK